jgi:hypothetical protein
MLNGSMAGMKNQLRHWEVLLILSTAQNHGIVFFDEPREVFRGGAVGICQLDVATPEPRTLLRKVVNQGHRLRIVHEDHIVVDTVPHGVFEVHLFEDARLDLGKLMSAP